MADTLNKPVYLSDRDHANLRALLSALDEPRARQLTEKLRREVERAVVQPVAEISPEVVQIGSRVALRDLDTDEREEYTLTLPERADVAHGRVSVLAPLGTAVLGFSRGEEIDWEMPGGTRHLRVEEVSPPEASA